MGRKRIEEDKPYWVAFNVFGGVGTGKFQELLEYFGSGRAAWEASSDDLVHILGVELYEKLKEFSRKGALFAPEPSSLASQWRPFTVKRFNPEKYYKSLQKRNIQVLISEEEDYPQLLREIEDPPPVLYVLGDLVVLSKPQIAVVGTRKMTDYGAKVVVELVRDLVDAGLVVTSGLAYGIDTLGHKTALEEGGKTIAVLGCGVDICYPPEHQKVYEEIIGYGKLEGYSESFFRDVRRDSTVVSVSGTDDSLRENLNDSLSGQERKSSKLSIPFKRTSSYPSTQKSRGAVVSEVPPGTRTSRGKFVARNRIISGLSLGVLVVEGARKSGTLITAGYGAAQGREVFAVPGPITSKVSVGPNMLIKNGAKAVTGVEDILEEINFK